MDSPIYVSMETQSFIQSWLSSLTPTAPENEQRPRKRKMHPRGTTPPPSDASGASIPPSPSQLSSPKKQRVDDLDPNQPPTKQNCLMMRPALRPLKLPAGGSSPVRHLAELTKLDKPVHVKDLGNRAHVLPSDVAELHEALQGLTNRRRGIFPDATRDRVTELLSSVPVPDYAFRKDDKGQEDRNKVMRELEEILRIQAQAMVYTEAGAFEDAWTVSVFAPLLQLALGNVADVGYLPTASVNIAEPWVPNLVYAPSERSLGSSLGSPSGQDATSDGGSRPPFPERRNSVWPAGSGTGDSTLDRYNTAISSKKVDLAIILQPAKGSLLALSIQSGAQHTTCPAYNNQDSIQLVHLPPHINQTIYLPLRMQPISVAIKAKTATTSGDPLVQLGVWTAAWHKRFECIRAARGIAKHHRLVTLPLISIVNHEWNLHYACDRGTQIDIVGSLPLGGTKSLETIYTLISCLQELSKWTTEPFANFIISWCE